MSSLLHQSRLDLNPNPEGLQTLLKPYFAELIIRDFAAFVGEVSPFKAGALQVYRCGDPAPTVRR